MANKSSFAPKIAFGDISKVKKAINDGIIDERDIVISGLEDNPTLYIIDDQKRPKRIYNHMKTFNSTADANTYVNGLNSEYVDDELIGILSRDKNKYDLYIVKYINESHGLIPVNNADILTKFEDHLNDFDNPHNVTYDQVGLDFMSSEEISELVDNIFSN